MSKLLRAAIAATISCGLMLAGGTAVASAQEGPARLTQVVPITGKATKGNKKFTGKYTIERFISKGGKLYAVGTVTGKVRRQEGHEGERAPARHARRRDRRRQDEPGPAAAASAGNACSILSLDLGPINLNLLGVVVRTNQIQLRIDAVQGPGNLLGNLLCGITGILNPSGASPTRRWVSSRRSSTRCSRSRRAPPEQAGQRETRMRLPLAPQGRADSNRVRPRRGRARVAARRRVDTLSAAWSSSPASSPPGASTSATTSGRSSSTSRARIAADPAIYCIVDLHGTTVAYDPPELRQRTRDTAALLVAAGLDPERCILFRQGDVPEHTELTLAAVERDLRRSAQPHAPVPRQGGRGARPRVRRAAVLPGPDGRRRARLPRARGAGGGGPARAHRADARRRASASTSASARRSSSPRATSRRSARACATSRSPRRRCRPPAARPRAPSTSTRSPRAIVKKFKRAETDSGREIVAAPTTSPASRT